MEQRTKEETKENSVYMEQRTKRAKKKDLRKPKIKKGRIQRLLKMNNAGLSIISAIPAQHLLNYRNRRTEVS